MIASQNTESGSHASFPHPVIRVGAVLALLWSVFLLVLQLGAGPGGGCGADGCAGLWAGRWGQVFGVPVSVTAALVYLMLVFCPARFGLLASRFLLGSVLGAAVWFTIVQAGIERTLCLWCLVAHALGVCLVIFHWRVIRSVAGERKRLIAVAAAAAGLLAAVQVLGPTPDHSRLGGIGQVSAETIHADGPGRAVTFAGGAKEFRIEGLPHVGPPDAPHVLIEYFDYPCAACATMAPFLDALLERHPESICLVLLPVPLERECNLLLPPGFRELRDSCEIARIALAVWRQSPGDFPGLNRRLLASPDLETARSAALEVMDERTLESALKDPWIDALIEANARDWVALSREDDRLPKLLFSDSRILHGLPSGQRDFIRVMERELGLDGGR